MVRIKGVGNCSVWNIHTGTAKATKVAFASQTSERRVERAARSTGYPNGYSYRVWVGQVATPFGVAKVELERHGRSWFLTRTH